MSQRYLGQFPRYCILLVKFSLLIGVPVFNTLVRGEPLDSGPRKSTARARTNRVRCEWGRIQKPNFALFAPLYKLEEGWARYLSEKKSSSALGTCGGRPLRGLAERRSGKNTREKLKALDRGLPNKTCDVDVWQSEGPVKHNNKTLRP